MKTKTSIIVLFLLAALLQACSGGGEVKPDQMGLDTNKDASISQSRSAELLARLAMQNAPSPETDYMIGPEDLLEIHVYHAEDLGGTVRVNSQEVIDLPLIGEVSTRGKTPAMLEKEIGLRLQEYIKKPFVSVIVKEYRAQRVSVVGAVANPQIYAMNGQKYLLDMLAGAGGLTAQAGQFCTIMRPGVSGQQPSTPQTIVIDLDELLDKGNLALNVPIYGGDIINVQKAGMVYINGEVQKADAYPLQRETTLVKAIVMAGGLKPDAADSAIKIYRDNGQGGRDVITANYDAINNGKAKDVKLAENDIIIVPRSGAKAVLYGILNTFRGFVNFGGISAGGGYAP